MSATSLKGLRVLLVEDQMIVALEVVERLQALGCVVIGPAGSLKEAMALARHETLDAVVLDVNLDGESSFPVAEELQRRHIPFVIATGYADATLPPQWRDEPRLSKPFRGEELEQLLEKICPADKSQPGTF